MTGTAVDYCENENSLVQFKCIDSETGENFIAEKTACNCIGGMCSQLDLELPETVSDAELLEFISMWAKGLISDQQILEVIEIWKNS